MPDNFDVNQFKKKKPGARSGKPAAERRQPKQSSKRPNSRSIGRGSAKAGAASARSGDTGAIDLTSLVARTKTKKQLNEEKRAGQSRVRRAFGMAGKIFVAGFLIMVITGCLLVGIFAVYVFGFVDDEIGYDLNELQQDYRTTIYEMDPKTGERKGVLATLHGEQDRIWISRKDMPDLLCDAFTSIEDERFEEHNGVDWKRTAGAFVNMFYNIYDSQQGGSTITQQLIKNLTQDKGTNSMRKIREIMRAHKVEKMYDKEVILECYLNTIDLSSGCYGVEVAANFYFGKKASELSLVECAALASITKNPTLYNPVRNPEENKKRRDTVLWKMFELGKISEEEYTTAKETTLKIVATKTQKEAPVNSFFIDAVIEDVARELVAQEKLDSKAAISKVYTGGFHIECTVNTEMQAFVDKYYSTAKNFPSEKHSYKVTETDSDGNKKTVTKSEGLESGMVIMDYKGHIVAMAGGRKQKTVNREFNFATHAKRQAGSSTKPISVYAPAVEFNIVNYGTLIENQPVGKVDGKSWPRGTYGGSLTVAKALEKSTNTVAVRVLNKLSLQQSFDFVTQKMHISTLVSGAENDLNLASLGLGGNHYGVTVMEMTAAYATFGNLGQYYRPTTFTRVYDQRGNLKLTEQIDGEQAMGEDTANIMNEMMQHVIESGTGTSAKFGGWPIFGKTGTATNSKDLWFVAGTPHYVAGVWVGFEHASTTSTSTKANQKIWKDIMSHIHKDLKVSDFPESVDCGYYNYCSTSGQLARSNCPVGGKGWYKNTSALCTKHSGNARSELKKPAAAGTESKTSSSVSSTTSKASSTAPSTSSKPAASSNPVSSKPAESSKVPESSKAPESQSTPSSDPGGGGDPGTP